MVLRPLSEREKLGLIGDSNISYFIYSSNQFSLRSFIYAHPKKNVTLWTKTKRFLSCYRMHWNKAGRAG